MRVEGWESLLNQYIEDAQSIVFEWGQNDCALWCADWVNIATGNDFASAWRGLYTTEAELSELLTSRGYSEPQDIPTAVGLPAMNHAFAQRGDVVLWEGCLGICNGLNSYFLIERGVTGVKTRLCQQAWAVR